MGKRAETRFPILDVLARRWSPRAFATRPVESEKLGALFEAARWAASAYNEQPWRFLVARREEAQAFAAVLSCLVEGNRAWAKAAPVLALATVKRTYTHNQRTNTHAWHDLGLATAQLIVQAESLGLGVHLMAGILPDKARETFSIPDDFDVVTGIAIGYRGDPAALPVPLEERERAVRERRPLEQMVFGGAWGTAARFRA